MPVRWDEVEGGLRPSSVECAWCTAPPNQGPRVPRPVSHGICPTCMRRYFPEIPLELLGMVRGGSHGEAER